MTDSNVVSLHGGPIESDRKALFLETVAEAFDKFVTENGEIPDGIVFAMGGVAQSTACWSITEGGRRIVPGRSRRSRSCR